LISCFDRVVCEFPFLSWWMDSQILWHTVKIVETKQIKEAGNDKHQIRKGNSVYHFFLLDTKCLWFSDYCNTILHLYQVNLKIFYLQCPCQIKDTLNDCQGRLLTRTLIQGNPNSGQMMWLNWSIIGCYTWWPSIYRIFLRCIWDK